MKRFARVVPCCALVAVLACVTPARAQSSQSPSSQAGPETARYYAEIDGGATFGHKSSGSIGAEAGYRFSGPYTVFFEGGRMMNVGTSHLDDRAAVIANAVGATFSASYKVNYFDGGLRYLLPANVVGRRLSTWHPYATIGVGVAQVRAKTEFAVNGSTVPPESLGIFLGDDLNGTVNKALLTIGGGVTYELMRRYFVDGTYRYGRIFKSDALEADRGINTSRLQVGFGVRF
jgi:opacity protein-like surface antigen